MDDLPTPEPSDDELRAIYEKAWHTAGDDRYKVAMRAVYRAGVATHNTVSREQIAEAIWNASSTSGDWLMSWSDVQTLKHHVVARVYREADAVLALLVPTSKETK